MKKTGRPHFSGRGFTLIELTIVMMVLLTLMGTSLFVSKKMGEWRLGRSASETLRQVYSAQRMFLSDNPTRLVNEITATDVIPYLPGGATAIPTVKSLAGNQLGILVNVSPPIINNGSGTAYDPSGNSRDSLWDIGE
jgi:prepilin-type N-terminal cleavage/methylation domain-containing protein